MCEVWLVWFGSSVIEITTITSMAPPGNNRKSGKSGKSGVRQRQSSSDNQGRPPVKKSCNVVSPEAVFDDNSENSNSSSSAEEEEEEFLTQLMKAVESRGKQQKKRRKTKTKNAGSQEEGREDRGMNISEILENTVQKALAKLVPVIKNIIEEAIEKTVNQLSKDLDQIREEMKQEKVKNRIAQDKAEQYSRRDNLIITGIKEQATETTGSLVDTVLEVCRTMEAHVTKENITAIHRLGKKNEGKNRAVIIKTTRIAKEEIVKKKKSLKDNEAIVNNEKLEDKVFINEDITECRRKLLAHIRGSRCVDFSFVREGTIICKKGNTFFHVNDADDLFKLGAVDVDYDEFYKM